MKDQPRGMTKRGAAARLWRAVLLVSIITAISAMGVGCGGADRGGDLALIPDASPTPSAAAPAVLATATALPNSIEVVGDVNVYAQIPLMRMNISEWRETDFHRFTVDPNEIIPIRVGQGETDTAVGRNGIPPIYQARHISVLEAAQLEWTTGEHPVAVVEINGSARAYPLGILTFHEVVNDTIDGTPVLVTFSPLTFMVRAFNRAVDGAELNFGTTGNVRLSNSVLWDDGTESWWQQADGQAIVGAAAGTRLESLPVFITSFRDFARSFPDGGVLSPASGDPEFWPVYGGTPYPAYDRPNNPPRLFEGQQDGRLGPKEYVLGVTASDQAVTYPFTALRQAEVINTEIGGEPVVILWKTGTRSAYLDPEIVTESLNTGSTGSAAAFSRRLEDRVLEFEPGANCFGGAGGGCFRDTDTGTQWTLLGVGDTGELAGQRLTPVSADSGLWFAWAAFNPDAEIAPAE